MITKKNFATKGFTLFESLLVITITAVILGLVLPLFHNSSDFVKERTTAKEMEKILQSAVSFYVDNGYFPEGDTAQVDNSFVYKYLNNKTKNAIYSPWISKEPYSFGTFGDTSKNKGKIFYVKVKIPAENKFSATKIKGNLYSGFIENTAEFVTVGGLVTAPRYPMDQTSLIQEYVTGDIHFSDDFTKQDGSSSQFESVDRSLCSPAMQNLMADNIIGVYFTDKAKVFLNSYARSCQIISKKNKSVAFSTINYQSRYNDSVHFSENYVSKGSFYLSKCPVGQKRKIILLNSGLGKVDPAVYVKKYPPKKVVEAYNIGFLQQEDNVNGYSFLICDGTGTVCRLDPDRFVFEFFNTGHTLYNDKQQYVPKYSASMKFSILVLCYD